MGAAKSIVLGLLRSAPMRLWRHRRFLESVAQAPAFNLPLTRVLILGVFLADRMHTVDHILDRTASEPGLQVVHRWTSLKGVAEDAPLKEVTVSQDAAPSPKFALVDRMLRSGDLEAFDFIIVCDDDIYLPHGFLPAFLGWQQALDFSIAQPARTLWSHFDLAFALQRPWLNARETRFVESGPMVSFRADAARLLMPFGQDTPLWGLDFVWPEVLARHGLKMGIVDRVAVDHSLRPQAASYSKVEQDLAKDRYLATVPHLSMDQAFVVRRRYAKTLARSVT